MSSQSSLLASVSRERGVWNVIDPLERVVSLIVLILLTPVMLATGMAIVALSGRTPLVAHWRIGQCGAPFWTLKFRSMCSGRSRRRLTPIEYIVDDSGPECKSSADPRVTSRFARFCRRVSIDELPQFINILRGEMSLVAPRPVTESELKKYYGR